MKKDIKNIGFRCTPERAKVLEYASADRGQSLQSMLEQGLALLLGEAGAPPAAPPDTAVIVVPERIARDVARYAKVLENLPPGETSEHALKTIRAMVAFIERLIAASTVKLELAGQPVHGEGL